MMRRLIVAWLLCSLTIITFGQERTELKVRGETVTILRDHYGIPHVTANTAYALLYGNGYAIAQDRLWQMERNRRQAKGELAELMGSSALEQDKATRMEGYTEAEYLAQYRRLPAEGQEMLQAYADGVNAWIKEAAEKNILPEGYQKADVPPREWSVTDSIAIGTLMTRRFGGAGAAGGEMRNLALLTYLRLRTKDKAEMLMNEMAWLNDPTSPVSIPASEDNHKPAKYDPKAALDRLQNHAKILPNVGLDVLLPALRISANEPQMEYALANGLTTKLGSYAILIGAQKSVTGSPILLGAPQMGFSNPALVHEIHLAGAGLNVIGIGFPGTPGVIIGYTPNLAWTMTSGVHDQVDYFMEKLNPQNQEEYWYKGKWVAFEKRTEEIKVKGGETVKLEVRRSVHGPIVGIDRRNNVAFSKCMALWDKELEMFPALLQVYRTDNLQAIAKACSMITGSLNFFCATKSGDIGFWYCGRPPIRAEGYDPRLPIWGTGEYDWKGIMPFADMPHIVNPKQGFIVNWNNKPAAWWDNVDTPVWGALWRSSRLTDLAKSRQTFSPDDVKAMARDILTYDFAAERICPIFLSAAKKRAGSLTPEMRHAVRYLESWDYRGYDGSVAKAIFDAWLDAVRTRVFGDEYGDFMDRSLFRLAMQPSFVLYALEGKRASVPRLYDFFNGKNRDEVLIQCLEDAIGSLSRRHGADMSLWRYSVDRMNFSPLPSVPYAERGTYIQIIQLNPSGVRGENVLPPGQSEDPKSPHHSDQRDLAGWFLFKPMVTDLEPLMK